MLLRELFKLPEAERQAAITTIVAESNDPNNAYVESLRVKLRELEARHGMTTAEMKEGFLNGTVPDDFHFVEWLILDRVANGEKIGDVPAESKARPDLSEDEYWDDLSDGIEKHPPGMPGVRR